MQNSIVTICCIDGRSSFSLLDSSGNFSLGTQRRLDSYTGLVLAFFRLAYFDPKLGIYFHRVLSDPYSDVLCSEECQTKKLSVNML